MKRGRRNENPYEYDPDLDMEEVTLREMGVYGCLGVVIAAVLVLVVIVVRAC